MEHQATRPYLDRFAHIAPVSGVIFVAAKDKREAAEEVEIECGVIFLGALADFPVLLISMFQLGSKIIDVVIPKV